MKYLVTSLVSIVAGVLVTYHVTTTNQRVSDVENHLLMVDRYLQQTAGRVGGSVK